MGRFGERCSIKIKRDAQSIVRTVAIKGRVKQKLDSKGIISKVNEPTYWLSHLVIVGKLDSSVRICLDPHELNKFIQQEYFLIST